MQRILEWYQSNPRRWNAVLLIFGSAVGLWVMTATLSPPELSKKEERLQSFLLRINSKYKRELYKNDYSIAYRFEPPNRIIIEGRYLPNVGAERVRGIMASAESAISYMARTEFSLHGLVFSHDLQEIRERPQ